MVFDDDDSQIREFIFASHPRCDVDRFRANRLPKWCRINRCNGTDSGAARHANGPSHRHTFAGADTRSDRYPGTLTHRYTYSETYGHPHSITDGYCHSRTYVDSHPASDRYAHTASDRNTDTRSDRHSNADRYANSIT